MKYSAKNIYNEIFFFTFYNFWAHNIPIKWSRGLDFAEPFFTSFYDYF